MGPTKVIPMPESIDNGSDWFPFAVLMSIAAVATVLLVLLSFVWEFDLSASPGWQVGVYHLMLALCVSMTFVIAFYGPSWAGGNFRWFMFGLAVLMPATFLGASWVLVGPLAGFRDERVFDLVVLSISSFMLVWMAILFPYSAFSFVRDVLRHWRGNRSHGGD